MNIKVMNGILVFCFLSGSLLLISVPGFAQAQYNIKEMTPEVQAALEARKARYEQLRSLKDKGSIGENNHGYVEALGDDTEAKALAEAENKDRKFIYKTIEQQNNKSLVREALCALLSANVGVDFVVTEPERSEKIAAPADATPTSSDHNVISSALEIFDGSKVIRKTS